MTPIEATVRIIETWSVTGKLSDVNVGETLELTQRVFDLFNAQKPARKAKTPGKGAQPQEKPFHVKMADPDTIKGENDIW